MAKTVLKNPPTTDQNVLLLISCEPTSWHLREICDLHSVCQCVISQLIFEGDIHHPESAEALRIKPYVSHMEKGSIQEGLMGRVGGWHRPGWPCTTAVAIVSLSFKNIGSQSKKTEGACWYLALLHWPFRATHYSHIVKANALKRLTLVQAGRANEQRSANYLLREQL